MTAKMRLAKGLLLVSLLTITHQHEITKRATSSEKRVVCYYTNWSVYRPGTAKFNPQNINPYLCTHLIYAFGGLDKENGLRPYDKYQDIEQGGYAKFNGLKTYNKQLKTMLAIGGWNEGSTRFSPLVADEERRKEFVKNVIKFLRQNHFDGLDLDWEYPAYRDGGKPRDKDNYAQLVQELREEFERESSKTGRPRLLLTMAVPAGIEYIDKGYDIPKLNRYLDFMNILSYDYHSAFEPSVNHHSPLYSIEEAGEYNFDSQLTIDATVKHYLMKGADAEKLVLGIPTYGRSYTLFNPDSTDLGSPSDGPGEQGEATREKGYLAYYEICNNIKDGWSVVQPKETAMGPYAYKGNQWVGYDDESIVKKKAHYVNERNLGGIMFWSIDNDDFRGKCHSRPYPLIEAAKEALVGKGVSNKLTTSPRGGKTAKAKAKTTVRSTTTAAPARSNTVTTPEPPTTPDPGSDFVCKDEGFFPHPRDCKKYFWCLDSGPSDLGIVAHQFTCPSGLFFNKAADSCDFARNVICKKKSATTTTTTAAPTTTVAAKVSGGRITLPPKTTTATRSTTTTEAPVEEEEEEEEEEEREHAEDPQAIKQLISLIKKLGGVAELEKQLEANSGTDSTTPAISKTLYQRVLNSGTTRYQNLQRNGPSGPQNEGLPRDSSRSSFRRDKPQYVTIRRERPSTTTEAAEIVYAEEVDEEDDSKYKPVFRNRISQSSSSLESEKPDKPKYQPSERFRPRLRTDETSKNEEKSTTLKYTSILRSRAPTSDSTATTSKYVILQRQKTQNREGEDEVGTTENELNDEEEVTEHIVETTTSRPRVKVSDVNPTTITVPTSTRVVTEIVEGATQRQRVPLSKLRQLIKDLDNSVVESSVGENKSVTTEDESIERPILHGFNHRRPNIVFTTTVRTTPASLSHRRIRLRTTTEPPEVSTRGRFVPSRTRSRPTRPSVEAKHSRYSPRQRTPSQDSDEEDISKQSLDPSSTERHPPRSRFSFRRKTTEKPQSNEKQSDKEEGELFIRGRSRESNVIRKPTFKRRQTTPAPVSTSSSTVTSVIDETRTEASSTASVLNKENSSETTMETTMVNLSESKESDNNVVESKVTTEQYRTFIITESFENENVTAFETEPPSSENSSLEDTNDTLSISSTPIIPYITDSPSLYEYLRSTTSIPLSENTVSRLNRGRHFGNLNSNNDLTNITKTVEDSSGRKKIILRRRKLTQPENTVNHTNETQARRNRTNTVFRRKHPDTIQNSSEGSSSTDSLQKPHILKRGKKKFIDSIQDDSSSLEDNVASSSKGSIKSRVRGTSKPITGDVNASPVLKQKRIIIRGRKKYNENKDQSLNTSESTENTKVRGINEIRDTSFQENDGSAQSDLNKSEEEVQKSRNKVRKVILRKPIKDLEVEESGSPEKSESFSNSSQQSSEDEIKLASLSTDDDLSVDFSQDVIHTSNHGQEIQTRSRRPFRKTIVRSTTTTTPEAPTTVRQRTTAQSLRQRLNRFKSERNFNRNTLTSPAPFPKEYSTDVSENEPSTFKPVRKEFRKLVRPLVIDDSQLDASQDVTKNSPQNEIRITQKVTRPVIEQVTEGSQLSEEYTDEEPLVLPDLANVAVAAIQSLATSSHTPPTEKYKVPATVTTTRKPITRRKPAVRPTSPVPSRSSPRPFSKVVYDEYDDYYAEPVEVPLSGKVRIHNDGYIECLDIGNFPHPFSCRKFISCAKMENSHLLGWEYTCPKGLSFDPIGGICNWNAGLGCKE